MTVRQTKEVSGEKHPLAEAWCARLKIRLTTEAGATADIVCMGRDTSWIYDRVDSRDGDRRTLGDDEEILIGEDRGDRRESEQQEREEHC